MEKILKYLTITIVILVIIGVGLFLFKKSKSADISIDYSSYLESSLLDATYGIDGENVTLKNGLAEQKIENSSAIETIRIFDEPKYGDLNGDGEEDAAGYIVSYGAGTGEFFFVYTALSHNGKYKILNTIFIGDRIAPQNVEIRDGKVIANYAERRSDEPFTTQPSIGVSKYFVVDNDILKEYRLSDR